MEYKIASGEGFDLPQALSQLEYSVNSKFKDFIPVGNIVVEKIQSPTPQNYSQKVEKYLVIQPMFKSV